MKTYTEYLWLDAEKTGEDINITNQIKEIFKKSEIKEGIMVVSIMHSGAGIYIDDYEQEKEINDDRFKRNIQTSQQIVIPITYEKLDLDKEQQLIYAELYGQKKRKIVVKVIGV